MRQPNESLPFIGWKPCENCFYLDALPINFTEAYRHWKNGSAKFMPTAAKLMQEMLQFPLIAAAVANVDQIDNVIDLSDRIMRDLGRN